MQLDVSFGVHCQYALHGCSGLYPCNKALVVGITALWDFFTVELFYFILSLRLKKRITHVDLSI